MIHKNEFTYLILEEIIHISSFRNLRVLGKKGERIKSLKGLYLLLSKKLIFQSFLFQRQLNTMKNFVSYVWNDSLEKNILIMEVLCSYFAGLKLETPNVNFIFDHC